jgi:hypothetical protein
MPAAARRESKDLRAKRRSNQPSPHAPRPSPLDQSRSLHPFIRAVPYSFACFRVAALSGSTHQVSRTCTPWSGITSGMPNLFQYASRS